MDGDRYVYGVVGGALGFAGGFLAALLRLRPLIRRLRRAAEGAETRAASAEAVNERLMRHALNGVKRHEEDGA